MSGMKKNWSQASLPVRWGSFGIRSLVALAPSAFHGSVSLSHQLLTPLLQPIALESFESTVSEVVSPA